MPFFYRHFSAVFMKWLKQRLLIPSFQKHFAQPEFSHSKKPYNCLIFNDLLSLAQGLQTQYQPVKKSTHRSCGKPQNDRSPWLSKQT
ncbi:hypothetical protein [Pseudomonas sp. KK18]|uniref:hypothetical protein n=1 Tax=Pseudomonas sp. KK18 TaxID=3123039 RepID=UPI0030D201CF